MGGFNGKTLLPRDGATSYTANVAIMELFPETLSSMRGDIIWTSDLTPMNFNFYGNTLKVKSTKKLF